MFFVPLLHKYISKNAEKTIEWVCKGSSLFTGHNEAIKCYDEAIRLNPKNASAWNNKGFVLIKLRKKVTILLFFQLLLFFFLRACFQSLNQVRIQAITTIAE